jgi:hypothetical protein
MSLDFFEQRIEEIIEQAAALPPDHDLYKDDPDPSDFEFLKDYEAAPRPEYYGAAVLCELLSDLSQEIRSMAWHNRDLARSVAAKADRAAQEIAERFGLLGNGPLPIHGSVGMDATGSYTYGHRY